MDAGKVGPRRIEIEPGSAISAGAGARAALAQLGAPMEKALVASLVPFGIVAVAVVVIGLLLSAN